ncbi:hypothetical protein J5N97_029345 [Dioscorea zingiberensis]|uniref:Uncharacterized protein n=1 Tax=Dioscorea zingiberensis TaxID=325984 RepID=A0A9D5C148_9LILI|nr:hypothetical protein J5N97_029345 [Dioscorea zingiberensis]
MGEREESMEEVRWERLLPRMPVRVLVVEGDDSTRQIITALLRKCGYRVVSVADGLKAWEMLAEKACHVDLVLTEVELPAISGFSLLSMIAEHENCKNIPVIMMSSHDSISMVFKCMLRGAADYLVKPIRKNELRNLWQHVWRRHLSRGEHAGSQCNQDEKPVNGDFEANVENNTSSYSSEYVVCMDKNEDNTEKGSDAQSSCTRSDAEAESQCMKNMQEIKHLMGKPLIFMDTEITQNGDEYGMVSLKHAAEAQDKSVTLGPECNSSEVVAEDNGCSAVAAVKGDLEPINCMHIDNNTTEEAKPKEAIDLIGAIDNHPQYSFAQGDRTAANDLSNVSEDVPEKHINIKPSSVPLLELSLRRTPQTSHGRQENDESKTLNHSNSSAFSLYTNRTPFQPSLIPMKFGTEREKLLSPSMKSQVVQVSGNMCEGETLNSVEDTGPSGSGTINQDETTLHHSLRSIPFPVPMMWQANGPLLQPMFAPQSSNPYLSAMPTMWKEALHPNSTDQTGSGEHNAMECEQLPIDNSADKQEEIIEIRDEQRDVSSAMVDSNNSICTDAPNVPMLGVETGKPEEPFVHDEIRQMDFIRLNQREAALNKYRLKRKDRCYGKKVRYQSRKLLAEQRPRVKGQFVRQVQHYSSDSVTA